MSDNGVKGHDHFFKQSMSRIRVAREFFETYLPSKILALIDLKTLQNVNTSFVDSTLGEGIVDLLYSVEIHGTKGYFWILCEHQSTQDKMMTLRIQKYMLRICSDHIKKHPGSKLPLIYPLLVYSGKPKYTAPLLFWDLFEVPELAKSFFTEEVQLVEVSKIPEELLRKKIFVGLMLYFFQKIHEPDILPHIKHASSILFKISKKDFSYVIDVLQYILYKGESDNPEEVVSLIKESLSKNQGEDTMTLAEQLIQKGMEKGRTSGIQEGMEKGKLEIAKRMLEIGQKPDLIASVTGLSLSEINRLSH